MSRVQKIRTSKPSKKDVRYHAVQWPFLNIAEASAPYNHLPYSIFYRDAEHKTVLVKGDCIEALNSAKPESVDMIFADPPYFLSNGGITCHAGRMVSVNKGKWENTPKHN